MSGPTLLSFSKDWVDTEKSPVYHCDPITSQLKTPSYYVTGFTHQEVPKSRCPEPYYVVNRTNPPLLQLHQYLVKPQSRRNGPGHDPGCPFIGSGSG